LWVQDQPGQIVHNPIFKITREKYTRGVAPVVECSRQSPEIKSQSLKDEQEEEEEERRRRRKEEEEEEEEGEGEEEIVQKLLFY
jgi:leucyl aminopeptidase (aminopeptidase T)